MLDRNTSTTTTPRLGEPEQAIPAPPVVLPHETAQGRISAGYAANVQSKADNRVQERRKEQRELAARFKPNAHIESMLAAREREPEAFASMNVGMTLIMISGYEREKAAATRTGEFSPEAFKALEEMVETERKLADLAAVANGSN